MRARVVAFAALAILIAPTASAKDKVTYRITNEDVGVPVFATDLPSNPYTVLGEVTAKVRKATVFSKPASQEKIYREMWERGVKMGADAVIKVEYGNSHVTALSWGSTGAHGVAVKFNDGPNAVGAAKTSK